MKPRTLTYADYLAFASRFWSKVNKSGANECWNFIGSKDKDGYGYFAVRRKTVKSHRAAYIISHGPIPEGLCVLHTCDNPSCCNPAHLWLGTNRDNVDDMVKKQRQAVGDRSGARLYPERMPRGERHASRTCPNRMARGERQGHAKVTDEIVREIRRLYGTKEYHRPTLAKRFGICDRQVTRIAKRKLWTHVE